MTWQLSKDTLTAWMMDPILFVRECFAVEPDPWQLEVLGNFNKSNRIALKASKGVGKSAVLAWLAWHFLTTRPNPKIAATSITAENLADGLWAEMSKWQQKSAYLTAAYEWTKTRISLKSKPSTWWMSARNWPKTADPAQQALTLAGLHEDYMLFLIDEAGGIPDAVMAAAEGGLATGIECKIVISGNPTHLEGPLYRACTGERRLWHVVEITGDPDNPKRAARVPVQWAREQIEKYGVDNPWVQVNVFGRFPAASLNALLGVEEVREAMARNPMEDDYCWSQKRLGIDVARYGGDRTVIFPRQGLQAFNPVVLRMVSTTDIAARVMKAKAEWGSELELIDDTGHWGHGVIDNMITAGASPIGIQFHAPALDPRYKNRRAEMWINMSEWVKRGGALPDIPELVGELITPQYTFNQGKFQLEDKDQIKQRLGRSPDLADALAVSFAIPDQPGEIQVPIWERARQQRQGVDWDPFRDEERNS